MQVEHYEPLVRQLCQGIRDPHVRSAAEQEGRIRLWRDGAKVDAAKDSRRMANRLIQRARQDSFRGSLWTGEGRGHNRCDHGDVDRGPDGRCRICERARRKHDREQRKKAM